MAICDIMLCSGVLTCAVWMQLDATICTCTTVLKQWMLSVLLIQLVWQSVQILLKLLLQQVVVVLIVVVAVVRVVNGTDWKCPKLFQKPRCVKPRLLHDIINQCQLQSRAILMCRGQTRPVFSLERVHLANYTFDQMCSAFAQICAFNQLAYMRGMSSG